MMSMLRGVLYMGGGGLVEIRWYRAGSVELELVMGMLSGVRISDGHAQWS